MTTLTIDHETLATTVQCSKEALTVSLDDGRTLTIPLAWYPRLLHGTEAERAEYELIGDGEGIHWPELGEDVSVHGLLAGRRSSESSKSLAAWLASRSAK